MRSKFEKFSLVLGGALIGILFTFNLPVFATKIIQTIYLLISLELSQKYLVKLNQIMLIRLEIQNY